MRECGEEEGGGKQGHYMVCREYYKQVFSMSIAFQAVKTLENKKKKKRNKKTKRQKKQKVIRVVVTGIRGRWGTVQVPQSL